MLHTPRALASLALALVVSACASGGGVSVEAPPPAREAEGVPGFDTREYPGDAAMAQWRARSPYRWVGYYLPAPCYTGTSWTGKRETLERMGWGMAVLFIGEQDWAEAAAPQPGDAPPRCTRANLTAERGLADGRAAADAAAAEGFAAGTTVFLDVERVGAVSPALEAYVSAWAEAVAADGRYRPGLYAHARNAGELRAPMAAAAGSGPPLWVAGGDGFDLLAPPTASGFPEARVWQGVFDIDETWGETTLRIDRNVADSRNPSG